MMRGIRAETALACLGVLALTLFCASRSFSAEDGEWQTETTTVGEAPAEPANSPTQAEAPVIETGAVAARTAPAFAIAENARLAATTDQTTFAIELSRGVTAEVFTLANPYRVVVDMPEVAFNLPADAGRSGAGLVKAYRYGLFAEGKARIVLDAAGPVRVDKAEMSAPAAGGPLTLEIRIAATTPENFGDGTGSKRPPARPGVSQEAEKPEPQQRKGAKPVVVIDPGHGGIDPGAVGTSNLLEKSVVLAVGLEIRKQLQATGRYDVRMTRARDVFVSLDQRLKFGREADADLFISLHADSIEQKTFAQNIRGATVYTLSERASDEQARQMAEKENASDLLAGIDPGEDKSGDQVKGILIDLMKRETSNFSTAFSNLLVSSLRKSVSMSRDPQRAAAFKVLKQTQSPAVLLEMGYMSHEEDERLLNSAEWQRRLAQSVANAVNTFFARQTAGASRSQ
jgi:N-acetylmuramoyl-L-alanine amidase